MNKHLNTVSRLEIETPTQCPNSVLNVKALVGTFNQERGLILPNRGLLHDMIILQTSRRFVYSSSEATAATTRLQTINIINVHKADIEPPARNIN